MTYDRFRSGDPEFSASRDDVAWRMKGLVSRMREKGLSLGGPAPERAVAALEEQLRVPFPADYRAYLLEAGAPAPSGAWRGLWNVTEVANLNRHLPVFQWFGGLIGIGNEGFSVWAHDYRRGMPPSVVTLGLSSSDWEDVTQEARTFEDWLRGTVG